MKKEQSKKGSVLRIRIRIYFDRLVRIRIQVGKKTQKKGISENVLF
jgi:hypothetical protein